MALSYLQPSICKLPHALYFHTWSSKLPILVHQSEDHLVAVVTSASCQSAHPVAERTLKLTSLSLFCRKEYNRRVAEVVQASWMEGANGNAPAEDEDREGEGEGEEEPGAGAADDGNITAKDLVNKEESAAEADKEEEAAKARS